MTGEPGNLYHGHDREIPMCLKSDLRTLRLLHHGLDLRERKDNGDRMCLGAGLWVLAEDHARRRVETSRQSLGTMILLKDMCSLKGDDSHIEEEIDPEEYY